MDSGVFIIGLADGCVGMIINRYGLIRLSC